VSRIAALRPNHHNHSTPQISHGSDPKFAVVLPKVKDINGRAFKHRVGFRKVQSAFA